MGWWLPRDRSSRLRCFRYPPGDSWALNAPGFRATYSPDGYLATPSRSDRGGPTAYEPWGGYLTLRTGTAGSSRDDRAELRASRTIGRTPVGNAPAPRCGRVGDADAVTLRPVLTSANELTRWLDADAASFAGKVVEGRPMVPGEDVRLELFGMSCGRHGRRSLSTLRLTLPRPRPYAPPVADISPARGGWAFRPIPPEPRSIVALIGTGLLDTELAAQLWLLVEARVPIVVAAEAPRTGKSVLLGALLDFLPRGVHVVELAGGAETYDWLPQASELGWPGVARPRPGTEPVRAETTVLFAREFSDHLPADTWGESARIAVRAASIGYGLAATIHADSLDDVFEALRQPPVRLVDDELSHLGVVLVLRWVEGGRRRIVAAHYVRPIARDVHGHLQRLGPAVLATWDPAADAFEHFGWGVTPELALRVGRRAGDFEIEVDRRQDYLAALVAAGVTEPEAARSAIREYRPAPVFDAPGIDA